MIPWSGLLLAGLWLWAIWSCAEIWRANPNYSYGWAVPLLAGGFALRKLWGWADPIAPHDRNWPWFVGLAFGLAGMAAVFALEFARQDVWHPKIVLALITLLAIGATLAACFRIGGTRLLRAQLFPVLFFLTALPWPPRLEQPLRAALMRWVALAATEILHWLGVEAQTSGAAIALRNGLVGITEACSGIRSLQAGIMFGLAIGEWFLLTPARRIGLLAFAILAALATNLARTLALALQAEWHGLHAVEDAHDLVGTLTITALIGAIWLTGKLLAPRSKLEPLSGFAFDKKRARRFWLALARPGGAGMAVIVIGLCLAFVAARGVYALKESREQTQQEPFFQAQLAAAAGDQALPVPRDIWRELNPTSGAHIRREKAELPRGVADFYHFFWKPSPWNRFVLVHRPDICMPGVGWATSGDAEPLEIPFPRGHHVRFYAFRFQREDYHALQVWGAWRNGEPVPLDYNVAQILGAAEAPALEGKRRSATEIIACTLIGQETPPPLDTAIALVQSMFDYQPR